MSLKKLLKRAQREGWVIPQFNFATLEQFIAIIEKATELKTPIILGTSKSEAEFIGVSRAVALVEHARKNGAAVFLHLDHGKDLSVIKEAIDTGYDSIHFDGSSLDIKENTEKTKEISRMCGRSVCLEGELGAIRGDSDSTETPSVRDEALTDISHIRKFVKGSGIDSLAISIGNVHGMYETMPALDLELLRKVREETRIPLVFHGVSGIREDMLREVMEVGVQKMNINTSLRRRWRDGLEDSLRLSDSVKPYKLLSSVRARIGEEVGRYINLLGAENRL